MRTHNCQPRRAALAIFLAGVSLAQKPQVSPLYLEQAPSVEVDGVLDEEFWGRAARLGALTATEPVEGESPTHPTEVLLAYDSEAFYLGVVCHDEPAEVRARQMNRDAFVRYDDVFEVWFDTFNTQRFGFWFQITAGGSRGDALLADSGSSFNKSWDGIWYGRSRVTDEGWVAEIKLPFKTLSFQEGEQTWGFNVQRKRVANGEDARWANPKVAYRFFNLAEGGELVGMTGMQQGVGLDVTPYLKAGLGREYLSSGPGGMDENFDGGLDLAWRPTPSTNVRVTTNTDFAETEVDDRRVNLSRFPLFFPEKRDFFLEDAGLFEFGPPSGRGGGGGGGGGGVMPFFSRTIGRAPDGSAVPIQAGVKFTGRVNDWNIGLLETRVGDFSTDSEGPIGERSLGVLRLSRNLGGESSAGLLFTHGNPDQVGSAYTYGADFRLGSTRLFGEGHSGSLWGYYVDTDNEGTEDGASYGLKAQTRSSTWEHTAEAYVFEEDYDPRLGFVRRTGVAHHRYELEYTWRGGPTAPIRRYEFEIAPHYDVDLEGREDRFTLPINWLNVQLQSEDSISIESEKFAETLDEGFELSDEVSIGEGEYEGWTHTLRLDANDRRRVTGDISVEVGDFYGGDIQRWSLGPTFIPSKFWSLGIEIEDIRARLDGPDLDTQVYSADLDFTFNPDLSLRNVLQYDTESRDLGWQSRLHWILTPGQDLFLVGLFGWSQFERNSFHRTSEELVVKLSYTLRF